MTVAKGQAGLVFPTKFKGAKTPPLKNPPNAPIAQAQILSFYGSVYGIIQWEFQCLAGANPPTITGGSTGNILTINRPRSLGWTMPTGYDPITLEVDIRFENWADYGTPVNPYLEHDIQKLHWMAGRGNLGLTAGPQIPGAQGNPPIVKISAMNTNADEIPLIPPDVQDFEWVISGLVWDPSPLRFNAAMINARNVPAGSFDYPVGTRGRQDATVTLTQWVPPPGFQTKKTKPVNGNFPVTSNALYWNVALMVGHYLDHPNPSASVLKLVMGLPANKKLKLRSARQRLKNGTKVYFPNSLLYGGG